MICKHCRRTVSDNHLFCGYCGNQIEPADSLSEPATEAKSAPKTASRNVKRWIVIVAITAILATTAVFGMFVFRKGDVPSIPVISYTKSEGVCVIRGDRLDEVIPLDVFNEDHYYRISFLFSKDSRYLYFFSDVTPVGGGRIPVGTLKRIPIRDLDPKTNINRSAEVISKDVIAHIIEGPGSTIIYEKPNETLDGFVACLWDGNQSHALPFIDSSTRVDPRISSLNSGTQAVRSL